MHDIIIDFWGAEAYNAGKICCKRTTMGNSMKQYNIQFYDVKSQQGFYDAVIEGMEFPSWCGKNLDAIWDMLTGYARYPALIVLSGTNTLPDELSTLLKSITELFDELVNYYGDNRFKVKIIS